MDFRKRFLQRLSQDDIHDMCFLTQGPDNDSLKEELYTLISDEDVRVSYNALWVFAHFDLSNNKWLYAKHDELIDKAIAEKHDGKKRLLLTLLLRQPFECDTLRTDFIDFCFETIQSSHESCSNRALCMKLAYEQCRFFPEFLSELSNCLEIISAESLSSGLKTARRNVMKKILKDVRFV
ncbi:hypothetical protein H6A30_11170 [Bacteroides caecigallinarum]|uniref:hypothetical protein n=1 Tax=Bacteroides caecigallinarum TaxID=1411144 RepID=UPI0019589192|nr:hypothetical protein [Bacteroides caecigallinarum]MBM6890807.1 hypothetical protein [Bacteroides caecigallinarum]